MCLPARLRLTAAISRPIAARSGFSVMRMPSNDKPTIAARIDPSILPMVAYCRVLIDSISAFSRLVRARASICSIQVSASS